MTLPPAYPALCPDTIELALETMLVGQRIQFWNKIPSTNDAAARAAAQVRNAGLVVLAEEQTAGRGRHGRVWTMPPGSGILMSVLLFPPPEIAQPEALVCLSAVSVAEALDTFVTRPVEIKWPNDLYLDGNKVGGILVERGEGTVIGIGINVHAIPTSTSGNLRATALVEHAAGELDRSPIVRRILQVLDARYAEACQSGLTSVVAEWRKRAAFVGDCVEIEVRGECLLGTLVEIDPLTSLTLRMAHGPVNRFALSEVQSFRPAV